MLPQSPSTRVQARLVHGAGIVCSRRRRARNLPENKHGRGLVDMAYVLLAVGTESYRLIGRKQLAVFPGKVFLLQFKRPQNAIEIDNAGYAPQFFPGLFQRLSGIADYVGRLEDRSFTPQ